MHTSIAPSILSIDFFLNVKANRNTRRDETIRVISSSGLTPFITNGWIVALPPRIRKMLLTFEPITFPRAWASLMQ